MIIHRAMVLAKSAGSAETGEEAVTAATTSCVAPKARPSIEAHWDHGRSLTTEVQEPRIRASSRSLIILTLRVHESRKASAGQSGCVAAENSRSGSACDLFVAKDACSYSPARYCPDNERSAGARYQIATQDLFVDYRPPRPMP